jgi:phosphoglycerate dehydrogenase-like enzyme
LVDEKALFDVLDKGPIEGAGVDLLLEELRKAATFFLNARKTIIPPH